jgi:hypothetical protein
MKNQIKIASFLIGISLLSFSFLAPRPITVTSIRNNFLNSLFDSYTQYADTTVAFLLKVEYSEDMIKMYAAPKCGWSPTFIAYSFYEGLDTAYSNYSPEVVARFKTLFGQDIIKSKIKMAAKDWEGNQMLWPQYSALGINAAFAKLYQKPTGTFQGIGLQKLYNTAMKDYVRDMTNVIMKVMANKPTFEALAKQYMLKATTDPEFDGLSFGGEATTKLGADFSQECLNDYYAQRVVGTMLRRQCDGSLPGLLLNLKTVLKDYDPEYFTKVGTKF